jgi:putative peptidoglycan lipid II flippase
LKRISLLTFVNILAMVTNMGNQVVTAIYLGAGPERDALFVAMSVPLFLNTLFAGSIGVSLTPGILACRSLAAQCQTALWTLISLVGGTSILVGCFYLLGPNLVRLLAPGLDFHHQIETVRLLPLSLALIPIQAATCVLSGYMIAADRVFFPSSALLLGNCVTLAGMVLAGNSLTPAKIALLTLVGASCVTIVQGAVLFKDLRTAPAGITEGSKNVLRVYRQAMPLILSGVFGRSNSLIERRLASSAGPGTISCLGYAGYLVTFLVNATAGPAASAFFARICDLWNREEREEVGRVLERSLYYVITVSLTLAGFVVILFPDVAPLILQRTKFTASGAAELISYSQILMISYVCLSAGSVLSRLFYAAGRSYTVSVLDCCSIVFYIIVASFMAYLKNGVGLAIASGLYGLFIVIMFYLWAVRQFRTRLRSEFISTVGAIGLRWLIAFLLAIGLKYLVATFRPGILPGIPASILYSMGLLLVARFGMRQMRDVSRNTTQGELLPAPIAGTANP